LRGVEVIGDTGVVSLVSPLAKVDTVAQLSQVTRIDLDRPLQILQAKVHFGTSEFGDQTKRDNHDVGADALWARGTTGKDVTVGVVDSGVDSTHPDLQNLTGFIDCIDVVPTFVGDDAGACEAQPGFDDNGHGTHVSGIVAGQAVGGPLGEAGLYPGMASDASLVGAKVCNAAGSCLTSAIMAGVRALAAEPPDGLGADVINLSLGGGRFYLAGLSNAEQVTNDDDLDREMNALAQQDNVLFSVAAGNSGPVLQSVGNPADASQVLAVGASIADWDLNHAREETAHGELGNVRPEAAEAGATGIAQFSSRGPSGDRLIKPDVTAPGVYVISAQGLQGAEIGAGDAAHDNNFSDDPTYAFLSGTSMAAPSAAGVAALVWSSYKAKIHDDPAYYRLKAALSNTAGTRAYEGSAVGLISGIKAERLGMDPETLFPLRNQTFVGVSGEGAGRVNAVAALQALAVGVTVYTPATIVGTAQISSKGKEHIRIPVQFFVPVKTAPTISLEGPVWAWDVTDYTAIGFENPLGDVFTDWTMIPLFLPEGTGQVDFSVYDPAGTDHMDVFVFNSSGVEIDSTISSDPTTWLPGGAGYQPTTQDSPETVSIFDGNDFSSAEPSLPATVWIAVSDSKPANTTVPISPATFHLDVTVG
jgi:subtilisin family serine protease